MTSTRVYYANNACYIDGIDLPIVAGTLTAALTDGSVQITADSRSYPLTSIPWAQVADQQGGTFGSADEVMAYLASIFALRRPVGETFGAPTVAGAALLQGQPVAVSRATGQLLPARADTYALAFVAGVASADTAPGFVDQPAHGTVTLADWSGVADTALLAAGLPYFLAADGGLTAAPSREGGLCLARIGLAVSSTTLIVSPSFPIQL